MCKVSHNHTNFQMSVDLPNKRLCMHSTCLHLMGQTKSQGCTRLQRRKYHYRIINRPCKYHARKANCFSHIARGISPMSSFLTLTKDDVLTVEGRVNTKAGVICDKIHSLSCDTDSPAYLNIRKQWLANSIH